MSARQPVICFAGDNYWFSNPHSRYHLMHALHRRGHPMPGGVRYNQPDMSLVHRDDIVEVAAHGPGRLPVDRDLPVRQFGQALG